ncbi:hypothetical protein MMC07_000578 [Pseudocyphellaria aurata]|nr:hypothetical protein [Pseudocyphellaria aurata]
MDVGKKIPMDPSDWSQIVQWATWATLKDMRDAMKRQQISFTCNTGSDYTFTTVSRLIKAAYQEIGQRNPFEPGYETEDKEDWSLLRTKFLARYSIAITDTAARRFEDRVMLGTLQQGEGESKATYLRRAERLGAKFQNRFIERPPRPRNLT